MLKCFSAPCLAELDHSRVYAVSSPLFDPGASWYWRDSTPAFIVYHLLEKAMSIKILSPCH
ncbi:hypothetical protein BDR03DRAFT_387232 [Suillus americanus]|nr:hypothetical protein BDR03DRAFT_387232 [Suillus americanus]